MANSEKAPDTSGGDVQTSKPSPSKSTGKLCSYLNINQWYLPLNFHSDDDPRCTMDSNGFALSFCLFANL